MSLFSSRLVLLHLLVIVRGFTVKNRCLRATSLMNNRILSSLTLLDTLNSDSGESIISVNLKLESVLNVRDFSTVHPSIKSGKLFRAGCVSNASDSDVNFLREKLGMKSWVDLRSSTEHEDDSNMNSKIYDGYQNVVYDKKANILQTEEGSVATIGKRFFIPLMSESLIKKGIFGRFRKRVKFLVMLTAPIAIFSRRAYKRMKSIFINDINKGGLPLLNEMMLESSGKAITTVLKVIANDENLPLAMYCTAGKDRTGVIAMLVLSILGISDIEIIRDYEHSDSAYRDINNKKAMVAALSQDDLDPDIFLRAKGPVMADILKHVRTRYGSVEGFLDENDFGHEWRELLRKVMLKD